MKLVVASSLTGNTTEYSKPKISVRISLPVAVMQVQVGPYVDKPTRCPYLQPMFDPRGPTGRVGWDHVTRTRP